MPVGSVYRPERRTVPTGPGKAAHYGAKGTGKPTIADLVASRPQAMKDVIAKNQRSVALAKARQQRQSAGINFSVTRGLKGAWQEERRTLEDLKNMGLQAGPATAVAGYTLGKALINPSPKNLNEAKNLGAATGKS